MPADCKSARSKREGMRKRLSTVCDWNVEGEAKPDHHSVWMIE